MSRPTLPVYLDCAATAPLDPRVRAEIVRCLDEDFGNAGSRTHAFGQRARAVVEHARDRLAAAAGCSRAEVIFTSGATESNNLALLGVARAGGPGRHLVSTAIEHHAVLEPLAELSRGGFEVTLVGPDQSGRMDPDRVAAALRPDTLAVSVMHVNNETGVVQPVSAIADRLAGHPAVLHVDAAQGFAREVAELSHARIDLISISAHKLQGPKGIGALIARRRGRAGPPLAALTFGGGQERGLRPGTIPVALAAGFGLAVELAIAERQQRTNLCREFRAALLEGLAPLAPVINGDPEHAVPHIINLSIPGVAADVAIDAWEDLVAISDGAACSSQSYTCSHVLGAMQLEPWRRDGALRFSWCAATARPDWAALVRALEPRRQQALAAGER